jgi:lipid-A-disaccharide synthase
MRIFLVAGEASGDAYAEALVRSLISSSAEELVLEGVGGPRLASTPTRIVADSSHWGSISVINGIKIGFRVLGGFLRTKRALSTDEPGVFVPIDFGWVNIKLCRHAKQHGWKILYFIPPGSWKRHAAGKDMASLPDAVVTPFPWSAELINQAGGNAHWVGHPLLDLTPEVLAEDRRGIAILPGSRDHELEYNLPPIAEAVRDLEEPITFGVAANVDPVALKARWLRMVPNRTGDQFIQGDTPGVLSRAERAIVCSGTATLQAAISGTPMAVVYRVSPLMEAEGRLLGYPKKVKFISLPNILADRAIVPELIQHDATAAAIRSELDALAVGSPGREKQLAGFAELGSVLGDRGAIRKASDLILQLGKA